MHIRSLTVIKFILLVFYASKSFEFNELEKIILVLLQIIIMYPILIFINKKTPILNGKIKNLEARD